MRRLLVLIALLTPLAACGQLPKPFQPEARDNVIASLTRQATILVLPTRAGEAEAPQPDEAVMAEAVAQALNDQGLLSTVETPEGPSRRLSSVVRSVGHGDLHDQLAIDWTLYEYDGTILGQFTQQASVLRAAWSGGNAEVYREVAEDAAPTIATFLERDAPEETRIPGRPGANLVVLPVEGGGEEGNAALTRAMIRQLKIAAYPVVPVAGDKDLVIAGAISTRDNGDGSETVKVAWRLLEANGEEIGVVAQENRVSSGSLESNWNRAAAAISQAAAPGIIDLLNQTAR